MSETLEFVIQVLVIWNDELGAPNVGRSENARAELVTTEFVGHLPNQAHWVYSPFSVTNDGLDDVQSPRNFVGGPRNFSAVNFHLL
jgi:hypothetical protein